MNSRDGKSSIQIFQFYFIICTTQILYILNVYFFATLISQRLREMLKISPVPCFYKCFLLLFSVFFFFMCLNVKCSVINVHENYMYIMIWTLCQHNTITSVQWLPFFILHDFLPDVNCCFLAFFLFTYHLIFYFLVSVFGIFHMLIPISSYCF